MIPISESEKHYFYNQAVESDGSDMWFEHAAIAKNETAFFSRYQPYYFQDEKNMDGRCFHICVQDKKIGQINYHKIKDGCVSLDSLIYKKTYRNNGYGTSAIKLLTAYIEEKFHVSNLNIELDRTNKRAIAAFIKAGYQSQPADSNTIVLTKV